MPKVRLNYDGWLTLPAAIRRALGMDTGDQLDVEVVDGRIVLRPLKVSTAAEVPPPAVELEPTVTASPDGKQGPGRLRKGAAAASAVLPPRLKARGAKRKSAGETPR